MKLLEPTMTPRAVRRYGASQLLRLTLACLIAILLLASQAQASPRNPGVAVFAGGRIVATAVSLEKGNQTYAWLAFVAQRPISLDSSTKDGTGWFQAVGIVFADGVEAEWCVKSSTLPASDMETSIDGHTTTVRFAVNCIGSVDITFSDAATPGILGSLDAGVGYASTSGDSHSWRVKLTGTNFREATVAGTAGGYPVSASVWGSESTTGAYVADEAYGSTYVDLCEVVGPCFPAVPVDGTIAGWFVNGRAGHQTQPHLALLQ